jgi:ribosomal protein L22
MMGKGKTSVFTPLLSLCIKYLKNKQPTVITASHLVKDTRNIVKLSEFLLQININVFSDYEAKERWIMNYYPNKDEDKLNLNNEFNIIDEFDSHHNYLQSMFNYVQEMSIPIKEDIFNYIFEFTLAKIRNTKINNIFNKNKIINDYPLLNENLESFYYISESMRNKESYGLSYKYTETPIIERIAIPFLRKDTPAINSDFSSILLRLILTFKIYILDYNSLLQDFDYNNIYNNTQILNDFFNIDENLDNFIINIDKESDKFIEEMKKSFDIIYHKKDINLTNKILKKYLYNVNKKKIKYAEKQLNMSFIDIIYNNHNQWQVGYTGTAYLKLNKYEISEKFVFREIIPDPEEKMEILLALNGFGNPSNKNKTTITSIIKISNINNNLDTENLINYYSLNKIIDIIIDNPRGFIDLAGLFINYNNKTIAENILNYFNTKKINNKNIIFLNENHEAYEINNENRLGIKYRGPSDNNFYYYDQTHTVGTDIKQPQTGHIAIIINKNNRMSEFAQAIFRFRKLNRGTYLSVILFEEDYSEIEYSNEDIYKMLLDNETNFNNNQKDGLKYQLFKAMIRKIHINEKKSNNINSLILNNNISNNIKNTCGEVYEECDIMPEFVRKEKINRTTLLNIIKNNIIKKDSYNKNLKINNNIQKFIKKIYDELKDIKELELSKLVIGSGNEKVTERNQENNEEDDEDKQKKTDKLLLMEQIRYTDKLYKYSIDKINFIKHLNCSKCINENCIKLFNDEMNIKINGKDIYISYNFLISYSIYSFEYDLINANFSLYRHYQPTLMYVEFNDKILIETFIGAMNYYIFKLPVYAYNGKIINPLIYNQKNKNKYILDIDNEFIELLGIEYKNPNPDKIREIKNKKSKREKNEIITNTINNLNPIGKIILVKHLIHYKKYIDKFKTEPIAYDISELFVKDMSKLLNEMTFEKNEFRSNTEHISKSDKNLDSLFHNICFPINIPLKDYKLVLDKDGYVKDDMDTIPLLAQYLPNREINELPFFK